jgi:ankyrin repeat protein
MVKMLVKHGASYSILNKYSLTPMDIAEKLGRTELVNLYAGFIKT